MGYCPFESRYNGLYRDTWQLGTAVGATKQPGHAHDTSHDTVGLRMGLAAAHAHDLARGSRDTKHCIVAEGRPLCSDTA